MFVLHTPPGSQQSCDGNRSSGTIDHSILVYCTLLRSILLYSALNFQLAFAGDSLVFPSEGKRSARRWRLVRRVLMDGPSNRYSKNTAVVKGKFSNLFLGY